MKLLTSTIRAQLLDNGADPGDHVPVLKLFNPCGSATWIISEMLSDGDTLFGLADLGYGCPEIGSVSLAEIESVRGPLGLGIERDLFFSTSHRLSVWAEAATRAGRIVEDEELLAAAARTATPHLLEMVFGRSAQWMGWM